MAVLQMIPSNFEITVGDPIIFALIIFGEMNEIYLLCSVCYYLYNVH